MGLHDRINKQQNGNGLGDGSTVAELPPLGATQASEQPVERKQSAGDPYGELKSRIHHAVIAKLGPELFKRETTEDLAERVLHAVTEQLALDRTPLTREERRQIVRDITDDILGYGPLETLLRDDSITEVMVNNYDAIYIERSGKIERTPSMFVDNAHLLRIIDKIVSQVGRRIDESSPMVDARLPDGSRVNAIIPPLSLRGPTLNAMSAYVPGDERIVTIEDAAELQLQQDHVITLESRPPNIEGSGEIRIRELVRNALRMRPDRIIVGEVRGPETLDMLQAMNTGHEGSLTTIHANAPRDALARLETLVLTAGVDLPLRAIREQTSSAFDVLVQIARLVDGSRRVTHITEVLRMESDVITLQDLFVARPPDEEAAAGRGSRLLSPLACTGLKPHFLEKMAANGVILPATFFRAEENGRPTFAAAPYGSNG